MSVQEPDGIVSECLQLPDFHKRSLLRRLRTRSTTQTLDRSNLALYAKINGLPEARQMELANMLEEDLYASDRMLARNIRLGKKRNGGKVGWPEVEAS